MKQSINQLKSTKLKLALVFFVLVYGTTFAQDEAKKTDAGVFSFENTTIDYGTINQNADGARTFSFTNTGNAPIVITQVKSSCGCTVPSYSKTPVLPGETSEIKVKYATNRIGVFKKTITVMSNASEANKLLYIKGEVLKPADETKL